MHIHIMACIFHGDCEGNKCHEPLSLTHVILTIIILFLQDREPGKILCHLCIVERITDGNQL